MGFNTTFNNISKIPSDVENRYIQALVLQEQAEEELLKQDSIVIRKETSQKV
jgi:hypothetical protein